MDSTYAGRDAAAPHKHVVDTRQTTRMAHAFWVVLEDGTWGSPLTVVLAGGTEAIALFSGEEEAQMFCRLRGDKEAISAIRQTTPGGVLSLLYCPWSARHVVLDPLPGILACRFSVPLALSRTCFARRFAGVGSEPDASSGGPMHERISRFLG